MVKKTYLSLFLGILMVLAPVFLFAEEPTTSNSYTADWQKEIELEGDLSQSGTLRSSTIPLQVLVGNSSLNVNFWEDLGNVTIRIYASNGNEVYSKAISAITGGQVLVGMSGWATGWYTIEIRNTSGGCMSGDFKL